MKKNFIKVSAIMLATTISIGTLIGCSSSQKKAEKKDSSYWQNLSVKPEEVVNNKDKVFRVIDGWPKPPLFQGNPYSSAGVGGLVEKTIYEGLFQFVRSTDSYENRLAESYENKGNKTTVKLRQNVKWHDGTAFSSKDIWAYYILNNGTEVTKYLESVEIPDENTVIFNWIENSPNEKIKMFYLARERQANIPYHIFKNFVDKADELLKKAPKAKEGEEKSSYQLKIDPELREEFDKNWNDFINFSIKEPIGTGPFKFSKVTETQINLIKNEEYWDVKNINFDKIEGYQVGEMSAQLAMLENGKVDMMGGTPPVDIIESILAKNSSLVHFKMDDPASFGIMFNTRKELFQNPDVRRALAYVLDRKSIREFSNYFGTDYQYAQLGVLPSSLEKYVDSETKNKLTKYLTDTKKAEELLTKAGWKKGANNIWLDDKGQKIEIMIGAPSGDQEKTNYAQAVADQWSAFGIPTKVKLQDSSIYWSEAPKGSYDVSVDYIDMTWNWLDPHGSLQQSIWGLKELVGIPKDDNGKIILDINRADGTTINYEDAVEKLLLMEDSDERNALISDIVFNLNENVYSIPIYQNVTGVWFNTETIGGYIPNADKIEEQNRNMLIPTDEEDKKALAELNMGFSDGLFLKNGKYFLR